MSHYRQILSLFLELFAAFLNVVITVSLLSVLVQRTELSRLSISFVFVFNFVDRFHEFARVIARRQPNPLTNTVRHGLNTPNKVSCSNQ